MKGRIYFNWGEHPEIASFLDDGRWECPVQEVADHLNERFTRETFGYSPADGQYPCKIMAAAAKALHGQLEDFTPTYEDVPGLVY